MNILLQRCGLCLQLEKLTPIVVTISVAHINLVDNSALLQLSVNYDIAQNWQIITALNFSLGRRIQNSAA